MRSIILEMVSRNKLSQRETAKPTPYIIAHNHKFLLITPLYSETNTHLFSPVLCWRRSLSSCLPVCTVGGIVMEDQANNYPTDFYQNTALTKVANDCFARSAKTSAFAFKTNSALTSSGRKCLGLSKQSVQLRFHKRKTPAGGFSYQHLFT